MTLTRAVAPPVVRRSRARRIIFAALLVGAGVVGQKAVDAIVAVARTTGPRASARYEMSLMLGERTASHIRGSSCVAALEDVHATVDGSELRDPWEQPYVTTCAMQAGHAVLFIVSGGPDGTLGTSDDIVASRRVGP